MNNLKQAALLLCACLFLPVHYVQAESITPTDTPCDIDDMMTKNRQEMDKMAVGIYKVNLEEPIARQIETAPTVKDASCLPILDTLDTLLRMRIPSTGAMMSGVMAKIRSMACKYANDFISGIVGKLQYNISDPYGIASVGVGASNGSGGTKVETYDFGAVVADQVASAAASKARELAREQTRDITSQLPSGADNRTPRVEREIGNVVKDGMNGL
jgi:hypothetical protein